MRALERGLPSHRARLPHVIPMPPTRLRPRCTIIARLAPASSPPPHLVVPFLVRRLQVPARLKPCRRHLCSLVRATSLRHNSSCQPRVMHVVLDTSLIVPRSRTKVSLGHLAVYGHIRSPFRMFSFSLFILDLSLLSFSSPSCSPCHRNSTTATPFDLAPAVAP